MSRNVPVAQATSDEGVLPERVQEALGELVGAARRGCSRSAVSVGLGVLWGCWRRRSTRSWVRRGSGTGIAPRSGMAMRMER